jgi:hypothetical protein
MIPIQTFNENVSHGIYNLADQYSLQHHQSNNQRDYLNFI